MRAASIMDRDSSNVGRRENTKAMRWVMNTDGEKKMKEKVDRKRDGRLQSRKNHSEYVLGRCNEIV